MKYIIANFKSHKSRTEYEHWMDGFERSSRTTAPHLTVILAPATPSLMLVSNRLLDDSLYPRTKLAIQDISPFSAGAYTGAVSGINLVGLNVSFAIVGHSERRKYFHETSTEVANKVTQCLESSIVPIVCVTRDQINEQANSLKDEERSKVIVAFEPVEHIGTGEADSLEHILEVKRQVKIAFGDVPFIYGGSIDAQTDKALLTHPEIDGFLVGSASLEVDTFTSVIKQIVS